MKRFILILFIFINLGAVQAAEIIKGTIVRVYPRRPISTENYQVGDFVYFVNPTDMWQGTALIIPKSTVFTGYVDFLTMPVQGINGSFSMKINKMVVPSGNVYDISASVTLQGAEKIGGEQAPPASYNKAIHYIGQWRGVQQWVPSGEYEFGKHTTITQKNEMYITFKENLILKD